MPRTWTEEERKAFGEKMKAARAKKAKPEVAQDLVSPEDKLKAQLRHAYQTGSKSIQDLARIYRLDVDYVLNVVGEGDLATVHMPGDMIDPTEAGNNAQMNYGETFRVPYSLN